MDTIADRFPKTVEKAVQILLRDLAFKEKTKLANLTEKGLIEFHAHYGVFIRSQFRLPGNTPLMTSCDLLAGIPGLSAEQASFVILKELCETLKKSNVLKIIK